MFSVISYFAFKVQLLHRFLEIVRSRAAAAFKNSPLIVITVLKVLTVLTQPSVFTVLIVISALTELRTQTH